MILPKLACVMVLAVSSSTQTSDNAALSAAKKRVSAGDSVVYVGAVLEYEPYNRWTEEEGGEGITLENARIISEYATEAKAKGADILVAPEGGLQSLKMGNLPPENWFSFTLYAPDPSLQAVPCGTSFNGSNFEALKTLSCAAQANQLYLVVDLPEASPCSHEAAAQSPFDNILDNAYECPENGHILYNTQVVFDRNGTAIARYRKKNLYLEPQFKPGTEDDDTAIFVTDFGVVFTLQVCFDIAFTHPGLSNVLSRGIKDVAMSTAWVDILPFFIAISVQNSWSRHLGVNLLVSGHHLPEFSKLGSGIYRGFSDLQHDYVYDPDSGNRLIISEVETIATIDGMQSPLRQLDSMVASENSELAKYDNVYVDKQPRRYHSLFYDDLSNYAHMPLAPSVSGEPETVELCHENEICCSLSYLSTSSLNYSFLAYSGIMSQGNGAYEMYIQLCAVVWCKTDDVNTCSHISNGLPPNDKFGVFTISGTYSVEHVYPTVFTRNLTLVENNLYSVTVEGNVHTLTMPQETFNLMSAALFARWYDRDPFRDSSDTLHYPDLSKDSSDTLLNSVFKLFVTLVRRLMSLFK